VATPSSKAANGPHHPFNLPVNLPDFGKLPDSGNLADSVNLPDFSKLPYFVSVLFIILIVFIFFKNKQLSHKFVTHGFKLPKFTYFMKPLSNYPYPIICKSPVSAPPLSVTSPRTNYLHQLNKPLHRSVQEIYSSTKSTILRLQ
jgi:hypothetical protein